MTCCLLPWPRHPLLGLLSQPPILLLISPLRIARAHLSIPTLGQLSRLESMIPQPSQGSLRRLPSLRTLRLRSKTVCIPLHKILCRQRKSMRSLQMSTLSSSGILSFVRLSISRVCRPPLSSDPQDRIVRRQGRCRHLVRDANLRPPSRVVRRRRHPVVPGPAKGRMQSPCCIL